MDGLGWMDGRTTDPHEMSSMEFGGEEHKICLYYSFFCQWGKQGVFLDSGKIEFLALGGGACRLLPMLVWASSIDCRYGRKQRDE